MDCYKEVHHKDAFITSLEYFLIVDHSFKRIAVLMGGCAIVQDKTIVEKWY